MKSLDSGSHFKRHLATVSTSALPSTKSPALLGVAIFALTFLTIFGNSQVSRASIPYSAVGVPYLQDFDSLPIDLPNNSNIQVVYSDGWRDDTTSVFPTHVSLPGWHLYHPTFATEGGFNGHQRLRTGPGANTGGFWLYGVNASDPEKALGSLGSAFVAPNNAPMFIGLQLTNTTGGVLNSITLAYDGEEWRDGEDAVGETLLFDYSLTATDADWFSTAVFTPASALNFTSPVGGGTNPAGQAVNGNGPGRQSGITATITGISWAPGTNLWLRWSDTQLVLGADDGIAIDNLSFIATPEPSCLALLSWVVFAPTIRRRKSRSTRLDSVSRR